MPTATTNKPPDQTAQPAMMAQPAATGPKLPGRVVVVFQGGGALGAYQGGVYQALHEAGIEPEWIIGTSIGALNGTIIVGNKPEHRLSRLQEFWQRLQRPAPLISNNLWPGVDMTLAKAITLSSGVPGFFAPNYHAAAGLYASLGVENASFYTTTPLRETLRELVDFDLLNANRIRMTLGAVSVCTGELHYFDSHNQGLSLEHVIASCSLPPSFPAVRIGGEPFWDGGIYSNTPIDAVFDESPRKDSVIFAVNLWHPHGAEPESLWQVLNRQKDISFASRTDSHIQRQHQMHRLRHTIHEIVSQLPESERKRPEIQELAAFGCPTHMHIIRLLARRLDGEDFNKDIDFTAAGIKARWQDGYADVRNVIDKAPWTKDLGQCGGVIIHDLSRE